MTRIALTGAADQRAGGGPPSAGEELGDPAVDLRRPREHIGPCGLAEDALADPGVVSSGPGGAGHTMRESAPGRQGLSRAACPGSIEPAEIRLLDHAEARVLITDRPLGAGAREAGFADRGERDADAIIAAPHALGRLLARRSVVAIGDADPGLEVAVEVALAYPSSMITTSLSSSRATDERPL